MSLPHQSIATINSPEFINLQPLDINPLMSKCEIKVFYIGENRNGSYINKAVATEMAKTLRGAPIVGYYSKDKEDFRDHGDQIVLDADGIHFKCLTKPYGFVAPDAEVWFQTFNDINGFGESVEREYLMTTGYLWTEQFPEVKDVIENGKPQSMELDDEHLQGDWETNAAGVEFFIINDAVISKLCILGDDVEPCFEGAAITKPTFSLDDNFKNTLFGMMKDLEFALKGEHTVTDDAKTVEVFEKEEDKDVQESFEKTEENTEDTSSSSEFEKKEEDKEEEAKEEANDSDADDEEEDDEDKDKKFEVKVEDDSAHNSTHPTKLATTASGLEEVKAEEESSNEEPAAPVNNSLHTDEEYADLEAKYTALLAEHEVLVAFKNDVEDKQKDELIAKFYMLSDEDKKDVVENKRNYSLEDIEAKLAVICYRKKVNFDLDDKSENEKNMTDNTVTTFSLDNVNDSTPAWIKAVEEVQNRK